MSLHSGSKLREGDKLARQKAPKRGRKFPHIPLKRFISRHESFAEEGKFSTLLNFLRKKNQVNLL